MSVWVLFLHPSSAESASVFQSKRTSSKIPGPRFISLQQTGAFKFCGTWRTTTISCRCWSKYPVHSPLSDPDPPLPKWKPCIVISRLSDAVIVLLSAFFICSFNILDIIFAYPSQCSIVLFKTPIKCNPFDFKHVLFIICSLLWFFNIIQLRTSCMWCMTVFVCVCFFVREREAAYQWNIHHIKVNCDVCILITAG